MQVDWQEASTEAPEPLSRAASVQALPQRDASDASGLISHFDDWANVLDSTEAESSLSRRGSGKLEGLEPDALRSTVDGLLKRQPGPSKLQSNAPTSVCSALRPFCSLALLQTLSNKSPASCSLRCLFIQLSVSASPCL